ncbi:MAG: DNA topoisomerase 4 subunit A [Firmicutes bacterium]|nr:DNA topoisomerase 4 subunit A [Bacillota bacterium]
MSNQNKSQNNAVQIPMDMDKVVIKTMEEVMHESMIPYSEFVILDRALPRVEDGLKPVQRRILYTMHELGLTPDKPHKKCARIVGDCLGKYHPHGDTSVYGALVRMAQSFSMGHILVDGHGNFGSIDGDSAAAMRYTEARLSPLSLELLSDIDKNTVKFSCNFDDSLTEPNMLPGRYPNLLVNGASGIAVGLATNIPPHNLGECIDGVMAFIDNPKMKLDAMMKIIKGPDFPSGGYAIAEDELHKAYETGKGKLVMRAKVHIELAENDKQLIVIDELPFQVNKATLLENISRVREEKKGVLAGISEITDESDRNGMRAVIKIKKDYDAREIVEKLFKSTNLSTTFGINMVAIAGGKPQTMGLLDIIAYYIDYQREVILRRSKFDLDAAKKREHILEGLVIAVQNIDEVIKIIKTSKNTSEARDRLRVRFELSERQAQAILDLRLARITALEVFKLEEELKEVRKTIEYLTAVIASKKMQMDIVKNEMLAIKKKFKEPRKTQILKSASEYFIPSAADAKPIEDYFVVVNELGNIKKMLVKNFNMATKTFSESTTRNEICSNIIKIASNERLWCFTNRGNCYKLDTDNISDGKWKDKGTPLKKMVSEAHDEERIIYCRNILEGVPPGNLIFLTKEGMIKKSAWSELNVVKSAFQVCKLKEGDSVITIEDEVKDTSILFVTKDGMCLNADTSDVPLQGRVATGVKGINLSDGDYCIGIRQVDGEGEAIIITDTGYAKRVLVAEIDVMARYRKGVKIIDFNKSDNGNQVKYYNIVKEPYNLVLEISGEFFTSFNSEALIIGNRTHSGKPLVKGKKVITDVMVYNDNITGG